MAFKDYFSATSSQYAQYRPTYPQELYDEILNHVGERRLAWDAATGNGQAAVALAKYFTKVFATDPSGNQIAEATPAANIEYRVEMAELPSLMDESVDLITVGVGAHWLDLGQFENVVERVAKPGAILAIWAYYLPEIPGIPASIIEDFYSNTLKGYWPDERKHIDDWYHNIDFGFTELPAKTISMTADWTLDQLCGYFSSWSAVNRKIEATGIDPVPELRNELLSHWPDADQTRSIRFPLFLKMWRINEL